MNPPVFAQRITNTLDHEKVPRSFWLEDGTVDWNMVYGLLGIVTVEDFKNALLALVTTNGEVAVAVHVALATAAFGKGVDPRHLPQLVQPPQNESAWFLADSACMDRCPGSDPYPDGFDLSGAPLCCCFDRADRWSNCLRYRERLFAFAAGSADTPSRAEDNGENDDPEAE